MCQCKIDPLKDCIRKGRAHYVCPLCGADWSMALVLMYENEQKSLEKTAKNQSKTQLKSVTPMFPTDYLYYKN